ncbi:cytosolic phospholipase A2 gamma-like [Heteronotia binoei]|uniref:cytosolic phospholipase A2 gamma-like n=1 Tax=Heteronotia binoei TaxID=13085 RepID=UPI00292FA205|nr:cytosolic phospholipase A2 gamma-like [Heteronotia binoei]
MVEVRGCHCLVVTSSCWNCGGDAATLRVSSTCQGMDSPSSVSGSSPPSGTWFEFTPHKVGIPDLGVYVDTKYFGSAFENGQMVEEKEEKNICYLQGSFHRFHMLYKALLKTTEYLDEWRWGTTNNLLYKCCDDEVYNFSSEKTLSLIDAGVAINIAYPLILHPGRNVKLFLSFDFSSGDPFETIEKTADHCEKHGIKFPKIGGIKSEDRKKPSCCYIFKGEDAPTVMHFPLFNKDNCGDKVAEYRLQFDTSRLKYSNEEIEKLLIAAKKNVVNARQKMWEEVKRAVAPSSEPI